MADDGYDPLPTYTPPAWAEAISGNQATNGQTANDGSVDGTGELICISPPAHSFLNSSFANIERFQAREKTPSLHIHPADAQPRQIEDGMTVSVGNERGSVQLTAHLSTDIVQGTVLAPGIWWSKFSPGGRNINQVTAQDEADMGAGASFYDVLVSVERVRIGEVEMGAAEEMVEETVEAAPGD
jgi:anaerobic selenocysteine-containing dehydrogenase